MPGRSKTKGRGSLKKRQKVHDLYKELGWIIVVKLMAITLIWWLFFSTGAPVDPRHMF